MVTTFGFCVVALLLSKTYHNKQTAVVPPFSLGSRVTSGMRGMCWMPDSQRIGTIGGSKGRSLT